MIAFLVSAFFRNLLFNFSKAKNARYKLCTFDSDLLNITFFPEIAVLENLHRKTPTKYVAVRSSR